MSAPRARDSRGRFTSTTPSEPARVGGFTEGDTANGYVLTSTGWQKPGTQWKPKVAPVETAAEGFKRQQEKAASDWYVHEGKVTTRAAIAAPTTPVEPERKPKRQVPDWVLWSIALIVALAFVGPGGIAAALLLWLWMDSH